MKIHVLLKYEGDIAKVVDLHATKQGAATQAIRLKARLPVQDQSTFHIIARGVKGLKGIKFEVEGKKRFLKSTKRK